MRMLKTFRISFVLRNAYKTNGIIYWLKSIPLIKKLLPISLYASHDLKSVVDIVSVLVEISSVFIGKLIYLALIFFSTKLLKTQQADSFTHVILFLTILGAYTNTNLFNPTKDKYYGICIMRMDARKYVVSNYLYFLLKAFLGFLVFSLVFGGFSGLGLIACLAVPILVVCLKLCFAAQELFTSNKKKKVNNENKPPKLLWITVALLLVLAFLPPYLGFAINEVIFCIFTGLVIVPAAFAMNYIMRFNNYRWMYKELLRPENFVAQIGREAATEAQRLSIRKKISIDSSQTSNKEGYQYFNELFMKRHSKLLTKSAKRISLICFLLLVILICLSVFSADIRATQNNLLHSILPYFLFVMYLINRGATITQAMFMNCDNSMLPYRFYRQPKAILSLFVERLKYIIIINLMPALIIALGLPSLLFITGGTDQPINYLLLFISILAMSVFFSVHSIVLYYIFQPYNINLETKSFSFSIANTLTYFICYFAIGKQIPTLIFGAAISVFCIVYVVLAFGLAYKLAPKTFRLK